MANEEAAAQPQIYSELKGKCGCELCRSGVATSHNDDSHDQSLVQNFDMFGEKFTFVGGTTKCGRVMSNYFSSLAEFPFAGKMGIEVGSGVGIVGVSLASCGMDMVVTDMEGTLELLEHNVNNLPESVKQNVTVKPLLWGEQAGEYAGDGHDVIIGSDLIYAKECHDPLVQTFQILSDQVLEDGSHPRVYLAVIRRFNWEEEFFAKMAQIFQSNILFQLQDITIYEYIRLEDIAVEESVVEEIKEAAVIAEDEENILVEEATNISTNIIITTAPEINAMTENVEEQ